MQKYILSVLLFCGLASSLFFAQSAHAYVIENLNLQTNGSIVVGPGKTELMLSPGDKYVLEATVANSSGVTKIVKFGVEDLAASNDPNQTIKFLGDQRGPYSLKDYVKPEVDSVVLKNGQRVRMPVTISIPADAAPGGIYGAIMMDAENLPNAKTVPAGMVGTQININTRVGSLLFIRINGNVLESSYLKNFTASQNFYEQGPVNFKIDDTNTGDVYLDPYGTVQLKDMFGRVVDQTNVAPWFVLPRSERIRVIAWNTPGLFIGRYTATLSLNRGYGNIIDTKSVSFWVIPWRIILIVLIGLILIIWFIVWLSSNLQFKPAKKRR